MIKFYKKPNNFWHAKDDTVPSGMQRIVINPRGHLKIFEAGKRTPLIEKLSTEAERKYTGTGLPVLEFNKILKKLKASDPKKIIEVCVETKWKRLGTKAWDDYQSIKIPEMKLTADNTSGGGHHIKIKLNETSKARQRSFVDNLLNVSDVLRVNGVWLSLTPGVDYDGSPAVWSSLLFAEWEKIKNYSGKVLNPEPAPIRSWKGIKENYKKLGHSAEKAMEWRKVTMDIYSLRAGISQLEGQYRLYKGLADDCQSQLAKWEGVKNWGGSKSSHQRFLAKVDRYEERLSYCRKMQHAYNRNIEGKYADLESLVEKRHFFESLPLELE